MSLNWTCPHCDRDQTVTEERRQFVRNIIKVGKIKEGNVSACFNAIGCANPECNKLTISFSVAPHTGAHTSGYSVELKNSLYHRRALPNSYAKPQPDFIPRPLVEDYQEACLILNDSPKASATLARRCIQGMIRDFCAIKRGTLAKEIEALASALQEGNAPSGVTSETVEAIDHVRSIGNIGAHMEGDINVIIPVDAGEAHSLIELIEMLFEEWYIARDVRRRKLASISKIGADKKDLIAAGRAAQKGADTPQSSSPDESP